MGAKFLMDRAVRKVVAGVLALVFAFGSSVPGYALNDHLRPRAGKNRGVQQQIKAEVVNSVKKNIKRIGILTGGGPASGHNQVIFSALKEAQANGIELIAIWDGWNGLIDDALVNSARPLTLQEVEKVQNKGATLLGTTRTNPYPKPKDGKELTVAEAQMPTKVLDNIKKLELDGLITLGGDDTNGVSKQLVHDPRFQQMLPDLKLIGLPKTMDNDINLPQGAQTYGFDSFVQTATQFVENAKVDADGTHRIFVAELFGRSAGFVAVGVGSRVGAARTLVPEEGSVDLGALVNDMRAYYQALNDKGVSNRTGVVIVSEGVHIDDSGNNKRYLEAAFKSDPVAKAAYEKAMMSPKIDDFGHPKLENTGMIIAAVLSAAFKSEKIDVVLEGGIQTLNKIEVSTEKTGYTARSGDASGFDAAMCDLLGKAAVKRIINGESEQLLYAHNGEVQTLSFEEEIKGRVLSVNVEGPDRTLYLLANQAIGMGAKDGGITIPTQREVMDYTLNAVYDRYLKLQPREFLKLTKEEMENVLWKLNDISVENGDSTETMQHIRRIVHYMSAGQVEEMRTLAQSSLSKYLGIDDKLEKVLRPVNILVTAANALIARAGALNLYFENYEKGVNVVAFKSLKGAKEASAEEFVRENSRYNGVFRPYKIAGMRVLKDEQKVIDGVAVDTILVPGDLNTGRPDMKVLYFGPEVTTEQMISVFKALGMDIDVVAEYGPGKEAGGKNQPARLKGYIEAGWHVVAASPINTDGLREMLEAKGMGKSSLKEGLYSAMRKQIGADTWVVDTLTCTSNAMISVIKAMYDAFGIDHGTGITVHAQTDSNETFPSKSGRARDPLDVGRGDSVRDNIIPASTGASKNLYKMIPDLQGKFEITAVRVGVVSASFWQVSMDVNKTVTVDEVRAALKDFALNKTDGVVKFYEGDPEMNAGPLDSNAVVGWNNVSIIDNLLIKVLNDGKTVILQGFYDNQSAAPNQIVSKWAPWMVDAVRVQQLAQMSSSSAAQDGGARIASTREKMDAVYNKAAALPADAMSQLTDYDMEMLLWKMNDIVVTSGIGSAQMMEFRRMIGKLYFGQIRRLQDIAAGVRSERDRQVFAQRQMSGTLARVLAMDTSDVIANADAPAVVRETDVNVYEQFKAGYSEVLDKVQGQSGALIIGAHVLENAGVVSAIKALKGASKELKVAVWADNYETLRKLDDLRLEGVIDVETGRGLENAIDRTRALNVEMSRIMVINSPEDLQHARMDMQQLIKQNEGIRAINLKAPYYKQVDGNKINAMPLVIGKAVAMIFSDKQEVVDAYMQMTQQYGGQISDAEMKQLTDLTEQLSEVPLVKVDDEIAAMQVTYEDTLNKI